MNDDYLSEPPARAGLRRVLIVAVIVAALGALFLFGLLRGQPDRDIESARLGEPMPDFQLALHTPYWPEYGRIFEFDAGQLEKPMVVNFWATWCLPCREEAPVLQAAWQEYGEEVTILGVQTQERNEQGGRQFISEFGLTFPNVIDDTSQVSIDWGLFGVPETFFIREDGTLAYKHTGIVTQAVLEERIGELLQ
ncbi:MAG TPA: TlpA disulfide reductase family protein [Trueperaceae bacterium]